MTFLDILHQKNCQIFWVIFVLIFNGSINCLVAVVNVDVSFSLKILPWVRSYINWMFTLSCYLYFDSVWYFSLNGSSCTSVIEWLSDRKVMWGRTNYPSHGLHSHTLGKAGLPWWLSGLKHCHSLLAVSNHCGPVWWPSGLKHCHSLLAVSNHCGPVWWPSGLKHCHSLRAVSNHCGPALMAELSKALPLTARCFEPLPMFESVWFSYHRLGTN